MSRLRSAVPQQLLPARLRPALITIAVLAAAVTATLGVVFAHHTQASSFDNAVSNFLQTGGGFGHGPGGPGPGGPGFLIRPFGMIGTTVPMVLLTGLLVYCCLALRRFRGAILVAAGVILASAISELVLKPLVDRTRYGSLSYPSGHATAAFALATAVVILLMQPPGTNMPRSMRVVLSALAFLTAGTVAAGLTEIHYFTDTIGGAGVGIGITLATALVLDRLRIVRDAAPAAAGAIASGGSAIGTIEPEPATESAPAR